VGNVRRVGKTFLLFLIFVVIAAGGAAILWSYTDYWKNTLVNYLNNRVSTRHRMLVSVENLQGNPLRSLQLNGITVATDSAALLVHLDELRVEYRLASLLRRRVRIRNLELQGMKLGHPALLDSVLRRETPRERRQEGHLQIGHFALQGVGLAEPDTEDRYWHLERISGSLAVRLDTTELQLDTAMVYVQPLDQQIDVEQAHLILYGDSLVLRDTQVMQNRARLALEGFVRLDSVLTHRVDVRLQQFRFTEYIPGLESVLQPSDYVDLTGHIAGNRDDLRCALNFNGQGKDHPISQGKILALWQEGDFSIESLSFRSGVEKWKLSIAGNLKNRVQADAELKNINLQRWGITTQTTDLSGHCSLLSRGPIRSPDYVHSRIRLHESRFDTLQLNRIDAELLYQDNYLTIIDTAIVELPSTIAKLVGGTDPVLGSIDIKGYLNSQDIHSLRILNPLDSLHAGLTAFVNLTGNLENPDIRGWANLTEIESPQFRFGSAQLKYGLVNMAEERFADVTLEARDGLVSYLDEALEQLDLSLRWKEDSLYIRPLHIRGENFEMGLTGKIGGRDYLEIENLDADIDGNRLFTLFPAKVTRSADTVRLAPSGFQFNDGNLYLEGQALGRELRYASASVSKLDILPILRFLPQFPAIEGITNGYIEYHGNGKLSLLNLDVACEDFRGAGHAFQLLRIGAEIRSDVMEIKDILVQDLQEGFARGKGTLFGDFRQGLRNPSFIGENAIDFHLDFNRFRLQPYAGYLLPDRSLGGQLTGTLNIRGKLAEPALSYKLSLAEPIFDRLSGRQLAVQGVYEEDQLRLEDLQYQDEFGAYSGYGYLPLHVDFVPGQVELLRDSTMDVSFSGHTKALNFLSEYISDLDDARGDYDLALHLGGTPADPQRSGNVNIRNSSLDVTSLENQITGVNGSAIISNNSMNIVTLTGFMLEPKRESRLDTWKNTLQAMTFDFLFPTGFTRKDPNLKISGSLDLTRFFQPEFDLRLEGDDIYFRSLLAEQEGIVDAALTMTGRDTVMIDGEMDVKNLVIRNEFSGGPEILEEDRESKVYNILNIHAVIPGNLYFRNSQLDCELEGEMWIQRYGPEPFQFSGNLEVRKGKFFYYGWEFRDLRGTILFDPTEFNPQLDLSADVDLGAYGYRDSTAIGGGGSNSATIRLTGDLEQPMLTLESRDNRYTQSDILMFLTRMQRSEGDEIFDQNQISSDAVNVFGAYFQRQLERGFSRIAGLDEFELRTDGSFGSGMQADQWSMMVGQRLAPNLYVTYERSLSLIEPNQQIGVEYRLNRNTSIIGEVDQEGLLKFNYRFKYHY